MAIKPALLRRAIQAVFVLAAAVAFLAAIAPAGDAPRLVPWDKAEHFIVFYVLTGLAAASFPRAPLWLVGVMLSGFGALIEITQAIPFIHRDCDYHDWIADTLAVAAVIAPTILVRWRAWAR
jgi:VanZ family protein